MEFVCFFSNERWGRTPSSHLTSAVEAVGLSRHLATGEPFLVAAAAGLVEDFGVAFAGVDGMVWGGKGGVGCVVLGFCEGKLW